MRTLPILMLCAAPLGAQQELLAKAFAGYDRNADKLVVRVEFPGSDAQFAAADQDRDGKLTFAEFQNSAVARRLIASTNRDLAEPRPRAGADDGILLRLEAARRLDRDGDGRISRAEWTGTDEAFASLDLDHDGRIDGKDRALAGRVAPEPEADSILDEKDYLPELGELRRKLDRDKDEKISRAEAKDSRVERVFDAADTSRDGFLDEYELGALAARIAERVYARNEGNARPRAVPIPFAAWDKNNDGRLDNNEWVEHKYLFARVDRDRDAVVTKPELERYVRSVEGNDFVSRFDLDGDGRVTLDEFGGPIEAFRRADGNGDGYVTRGER
jgi:Ca2+-binding EF-hand superfamily protein